MLNRQKTRDQVNPEYPPNVTDEEREILDRADIYLRTGLELKRWWEKTNADDSYAERFEEALTFNRPDVSFGFFDKATIDGRTIPVLGNVQDMFYDEPKVPSSHKEEAIEWMHDQIREFVLHYFLRISDFRSAQAVLEDDHGHPDTPSPFLTPLSLCPPEDLQHRGFGFSQHFYKLCDTGKIDRFPEDERYTIVDLREIGEKYEWVLLKVQIYDFKFTYYPFGDNGPNLVLPLNEASYLVVTRDFITNEENPEPGILGKYGFGYAFIKNPGESLLGWGPGEFNVAFQTINFRYLEDGKARVRMVFGANRPEKILNISLNPVNFGFTMADLMSFGMASRILPSMKSLRDKLPFTSKDADPVYGFFALANLLTGGFAAKELCYSRDDLDRQLVTRHFLQHYQTIVGSLQTWRQIPNWLAGDENLPRWVVKGISS